MMQQPKNSDDCAAPNVLHVVWNLIRGGTEGQCARVALGLVERGWPTRVAVSRREGFFLTDVETACGPVHEVDIHRMFSIHTLLEVRRLSRFIRAQAFDLVHCWDADAEIFGSLAARWAGVPYITSRRDMGAIYSPRKLRLMSRADRRAQRVVVNAKAIRDDLIGHGLQEHAVVVLPNVVDLEELDRLAEGELSVTLPEGRLIVAVARLDPEKDTETMIRAMSALVPDFPDVSLVVAGDGPERARLERVAADRELSHKVLFLGDVTDVPPMLKRTTIGVLVPSSNEGLSNTILEYMAAGLPVVATDCGGNSELVHEGANGYVIPIGDDQSLASRLAELLKSSDRCESMGREGRRRVEETFSKGVVLDQFEAMYRSIL